MEDKTAKRTAPDKSEVHPLNMIKVTMEDLTEADREEIEEEIAREMEEKRNERLACFRKTKNGVIKQTVGASTSGKKVSSSVTCEELAHMIDTSVASKYGADVTEITRMISEGVRNSFDAFRSEFKQDISNNMPRQIRSIVQQIQEESQGKRAANSSGTSSFGIAVAPNTIDASAKGTSGSAVANSNLQQPYYQNVAYGPSINPIGNRVPQGSVPNRHVAGAQGALCSAPFVTPVTYDGEAFENVREQVARTLREFGFEPKGHTRSYKKPYLDFFDTVTYPRGFRIPDFVKFLGDDSKTTYEHVGQYLAQVNDIGITDAHKVKLFPLSLSSTAFNWFTSLAPNSINTWACLEKKFHDYFYCGETELRLSHLTTVRQKYNETVPEYIKRFRETRNRCYNLTLGERDLADLAFAGLSSYLKEK
jgi:hypothetical protein